MHSSSSSLGKVRTIGNPSLLGKTTDRHDFAIYSLFAEFLASRQKSSALQALLREIGMSEDMLYSPEQIGQALSLMRNQIFSKCLERLGNGPLVERIFRELVHRTPRMCSNSTQTDDSDSPRTNISRESSGLRLESSALKILSGRKSASESVRDLRTKREEFTKRTSADEESVYSGYSGSGWGESSQMDSMEMLREAQHNVEQELMEKVMLKQKKLEQQAEKRCREAALKMESALKQHDIMAKELKAKDDHLQSCFKKLSVREQEVSANEYQIAELQKCSRDVVAERDALKVRHDELERECTQLMRCEQTAQQSVVRTEQQSRESEAGIAILERQLANTEREVANRNLELMTYRSEFCESVQEIQLLRDAHSNLTEHVESSKRLCASSEGKLQKEMHENWKQKLQYEEQVGFFRDETGKLENMLESYSEQVAAKDHENIELHARVALMEVAVENERFENDSQARTFREGVTGLKVQLSEANLELEASQTLHNTCTQELEQEKWKLEKAEVQMKTACALEHRRREECVELQDQLKEVHSELKWAEGEKEGVQQEEGKWEESAMLSWEKVNTLEKDKHELAKMLNSMTEEKNTCEAQKRKLTHEDAEAKEHAAQIIAGLNKHLEAMQMARQLEVDEFQKVVAETRCQLNHKTSEVDLREEAMQHEHRRHEEVTAAKDHKHATEMKVLQARVKTMELTIVERNRAITKNKVVTSLATALMFCLLLRNSFFSLLRKIVGDKRAPSTLLSMGTAFSLDPATGVLAKTTRTLKPSYLMAQ